MLCWRLQQSQANQNYTRDFLQESFWIWAEEIWSSYWFFHEGLDFPKTKGMSSYWFPWPTERTENSETELEKIGIERETGRRKFSIDSSVVDFTVHWKITQMDTFDCNKLWLYVYSWSWWLYMNLLDLKAGPTSGWAMTSRACSKMSVGTWTSELHFSHILALDLRPLMNPPVADKISYPLRLCPRSHFQHLQAKCREIVAMPKKSPSICIDNLIV